MQEKSRGDCVVCTLCNICVLLNCLRRLEITKLNSVAIPRNTNLFSTTISSRHDVIGLGLDGLCSVTVGEPVLKSSSEFMPGVFIWI